jgi:pilus assembly protein CpaC
MRRTTPVLRSLWRLLIVGLMATLGAGAASAQEQVPVLVIPINTTKQVEMSKKQVIAEVRNENPKVCRVQSIIQNPNAVLITGLAPGTSRVTFKDGNNVTEMIDISVTTEDEILRAQLRREFLDQMSKTVPGARLDVIINSKTTIITGVAPDANAVRIVGEAARNTFGGNVVMAVVLPGQEPVVNVPRVQQVELEVLVATVNRSETRKLAVNFIVNREDFFVSSIVGPGTAFTNTIASAITGASSAAGSSQSLTFGVIGDRGSFSAFIDALRTEGLVKILSEPRVTALSGQRANILSGGETPVLSSSGTGAPTVQYREFGTRVEFTPLVLENGKIQLDVEASLSNIDPSSGISIPSDNGLTSVPGFATRRARTVVHVEDGQTVAIGGLIQNTVNATITKIPVLGDLPYFGAAFSSKNYLEREEELIILVTPRLIDPLSCCQLPRYLPGRETRSPDDFELFLTQLMEAPRGQREIGNGHYRAAHLEGPSASVYPCNDTSTSHGWNRGCSRLGGRGRCGPKCRGSACGKDHCVPNGPVHGALNGHTNNPQPMATPAATAPAAGNPLTEIPVRDTTPGLIPPTPTLPPIGENSGLPEPLVPGNYPPIPLPGER